VESEEEEEEVVEVEEDDEEEAGEHNEPERPKEEDEEPETSREDNAEPETSREDNAEPETSREDNAEPEPLTEEASAQKLDTEAELTESCTAEDGLDASADVAGISPMPWPPTQPPLDLLLANWKNWRSTLQDVVASHPPLGVHLDAERPAPDPAHEPAARRNWDLDDRVVASLICLHLSEAELDFVESNRTSVSNAYQLLEILRVRHTPLGTSTRVSPIYAIPLSVSLLVPLSYFFLVWALVHIGDEL
jgi:hypothetical protein